MTTTTDQPPQVTTRMTPNQYQRLALRTECIREFLDVELASAFARSIGTENDLGPIAGERLLHGAIGLCTEVGELQDAIKKFVFYKKPIDRVNLMEECGDLLWYIAIVLDAAGYTMCETMTANINKLRLRFPDKYNDEDANVRDLAAERAALEEVTK